MCIPSRLVLKCVKDSKRRWTHSNREPRGRSLFRLNNRKSALQKIFHFFFFPFFCFQPNPKRYCNHLISPSELTHSRIYISCVNWVSSAIASISTAFASPSL